MSGKQTAIIFTVITIVCALYSLYLQRTAEPDAPPSLNTTSRKP